MRTLSIFTLFILGCQPEESTWEPHIVCDSEAPATMGATPLKRITRSQYDHVLKDVFALDGAVSEVLAQDEQVGHFVSNAYTAMDMTTVQMYQTAAETAANQMDFSTIDACNLLTTAPATCAKDFIESTGRRLFRRPLRAEEVEVFLGLYSEFSEGNHTAGLHVVVRALLQSPEFLYHPDYRISGQTNGEIVPLDGVALASRLSFFLWDSVPDDALMAAAQSGALGTDEGLRTETLRMLADMKTARGIERFHAQWLGFDHLEEVIKDEGLFPQYTDEVVAGLKQETADFADYVIRYGDGELDTLLSADFTILNQAIEDFYTLPEPAALQPMTPTYLDSSKRAGILSHASVLAATAHNQTTSLSRRGQLIRERLFCQPITQPPANANLELPDLGPNATTRERVEAHTQDPVCASCHEKMDYIGFGFEHYDAIGQFRATENGQSIDASGELTGTDVDGWFNGAPELADLLLDSKQVKSCVSRQWMTYALGRELDDRDGCSMSEAYSAMHQPNNLRELLLSIVMSNSFRNRRADEGGVHE